MHFGSYGSVDDGAAVFDRLRAAAEVAEAAHPWAAGRLQRQTVFVFATDDLAKLATDARAFAKAGADGIAVSRRPMSCRRRRRSPAR